MLRSSSSKDGGLSTHRQGCNSPLCPPIHQMMKYSTNWSESIQWGSDGVANVPVCKTGFRKCESSLPLHACVVLMVA